MRFQAASAVIEAGEGSWKADVQPDWDIFGVSNGGYLMAIAARAMSEASGGRLPVSLTAHFVRPISAGPVEIGVQTVKVGRTFSTMRATVSTTAASIELLGSFTESSNLDASTVYLDSDPPDLPPPDECGLVVPRPGQPLPPPLTAQFEERIHPDDGGPILGRPSGEALVRGWFRLHDDEPVDVFTLLLVADAFPPAVFNADLPLAWTPTLEMTTQIRAHPVPGWLRCRFRTRLISGGFLEEDGEIWDESGQLVAQSRQLGLVPR